MPYKRKGIYYVDLRPPGYPRRIGPLSTRQTRKDVARDMESTVRTFARDGRHKFLDGLLAGEFTLTDLHAAKVAGRLDELTDDKIDRPLEGVLKDFLVGHDRRYAPIVRRILKQAGPGARLSWLADSENVQAIVRQYEAEGLTADTERREVSAIKLILSEQLGKATRTQVFDKVQLRRTKKGRTRWLNRDEIRSVREVAGDWWPVIELALVTGIRRGELLNLLVRDLDLQAGTLTVEHGKSESARRMLPLSGELPALLRGWIAAEELEPQDRLFPGVTERRLQAAWTQIREAAKIADVRFHDLRHSYAVQMTKAGMPLVELKNRLGHSSIEQTDRYAAYIPPIASTHTKQALENMGLGEIPTPATTGEAETPETVGSLRLSPRPTRAAPWATFSPGSSRRQTPGRQLRRERRGR